MITQEDKETIMYLMDSMIKEKYELNPEKAGAEYLDQCPQFCEIFELICKGLAAEDKFKIFKARRGLTGVENLYTGFVRTFTTESEAKDYVEAQSKQP